MTAAAYTVIRLEKQAYAAFLNQMPFGFCWHQQEPKGVVLFAVNHDTGEVAKLVLQVTE